MHIHGRCGAVSIFHAKPFEDRGCECTFPQANRIAFCALSGALSDALSGALSGSLSADLDSEELASGSQVGDPVLSRELGVDIIDRLDCSACIG